MMQTHPGSEHQFTAPVTGKISAVYIDYMDDPQHDPDQEIGVFHDHAGER